ncbi:hypothetical protein D3C72_1463300 [compost metagenome]
MRHAIRSGAHHLAQQRRRVRIALHGQVARHLGLGVDAARDPAHHLEHGGVVIGQRAVGLLCRHVFDRVALQFQRGQAGFGAEVDDVVAGVHLHVIAQRAHHLARKGLDHETVGGQPHAAALAHARHRQSMCQLRHAVGALAVPQDAQRQLVAFGAARQGHLHLAQVDIFAAAAARKWQQVRQVDALDALVLGAEPAAPADVVRQHVAGHDAARGVGQLRPARVLHHQGDLVRHLLGCFHVP